MRTFLKITLLLVTTTDFFFFLLLFKKMLFYYFPLLFKLPSPTSGICLICTCSLKYNAGFCFLSYVYKAEWNITLPV